MSLFGYPAIDENCSSSQFVTTTCLASCSALGLVGIFDLPKSLVKMRAVQTGKRKMVSKQWQTLHDLFSTFLGSNEKCD